MRKQENLFVIIIAGPTGVGKTTLSKMLSRYYDCAYLSEDEIAKEIFPEQYKNLEDYPDKVEIIAGELFKRAKVFFNDGKCIVIDLINLEKEFVQETQKTFQHHLIVKVLWPPLETTIERDRKREGWTSGENAIKRFYKKYEELKPVIGEKNYIDNSFQTPEETFEGFVACIK
jgi:adenylate kinase family enzyme